MSAANPVVQPAPRPPAPGWGAILCGAATSAFLFAVLSTNTAIAQMLVAKLSTVRPSGSAGLSGKDLIDVVPVGCLILAVVLVIALLLAIAVGAPLALLLGLVLRGRGGTVAHVVAHAALGLVVGAVALLVILPPPLLGFFWPGFVIAPIATAAGWWWAIGRVHGVRTPSLAVDLATDGEETL